MTIRPAPQDTPPPVVVLGAGLAGLTVALHLVPHHPVVVLAKRNLDEAATAWAQGGIVGVLGSDDSIESHVRDTQDAGAGLVDEHTARFIARHSAEAVEWLVQRDGEAGKAGAEHHDGRRHVLGSGSGRHVGSRAHRRPSGATTVTDSIDAAAIALRGRARRSADLYTASTSPCRIVREARVRTGLTPP